MCDLCLHFFLDRIVYILLRSMTVMYAQTGFVNTFPAFLKGWLLSHLI